MRCGPEHVGVAVDEVGRRAQLATKAHSRAKAARRSSTQPSMSCAVHSVASTASVVFAPGIREASVREVALGAFGAERYSEGVTQ